VTGTTTGLSVLGADDDGESSLTYNWAVTSQPSGVTTPSFSINGTNAAKNSTATFYAAGNYTFQVTITDTSSLSVTSSVTVTVNQTQTSISDSPGSVTLPDGATQQFTASALDQFGLAMASQPSFTWSVAAGGVGGTVSGSGLYTAPSTGTGTATVIAAASSLSGTATVTVASIPAPPSNLTATAVSRHQVNLTWVDNSGNESGFKIQRSPDQSSWTQIATVGQNTTSYSDTTVRRGRTYYYRVAAYNAAGTSAWSNTASATPNTPSTITPGGSAQQYPPPDKPLYVNPKHLRRWQYYHEHQIDPDQVRAKVARPAARALVNVRIKTIEHKVH
jgi:hypothetical protein